MKGRVFGRVFILGLIMALLLIPNFMASASDPTEITRVSTDSAGQQLDQWSYGGHVSADGGSVAFSSHDSDLVPGDTNNYTDAFIKDIQSGSVTRVSTDSTGAEGNSDASANGVSADGRYVVFDSTATNLVPGDTNGQTDVFVKDTQTGTTTRVSTDSAGAEGNLPSIASRISEDGRYFVFESDSTNLVAGDTNGTSDIFLKDIQTGTTTRVSTDSANAQANDYSGEPEIAANDQYVVFYSSATNLTPGDTNSVADVFVKNLGNGAMVRVSTDSAGNQGDNVSFQPAISADGQYVAYSSHAANLVPTDLNGEGDVFLKDMSTGITRQVSSTPDGNPGNGFSVGPSISADGRYVIFRSWASNLAWGDSDGRQDAFIKDMSTRAIWEISKSVDGAHIEASGADNPEISSDGRFAVFHSEAGNLVVGDTNDTMDIFLAPNPAMTTSFSTTAYFPWYDSQGGKTWLLMAQPSAGSAAAQNNSFDVFLRNMGSPTLELLTPGGPLAVNQGTTQAMFQAGKIGGPVKIVPLQGEGIVSERSLFGNSFEEIGASYYEYLDSHYWWPIYDSASAGMKNWVLVANPPENGEIVTARVTIHGTGISDVKDLAPGESWTPLYAGIYGGPVEVTAWKQGGIEQLDGRKVIASQRVLYNGAFNELPGIPAFKLSTYSMWTWYDNVGGSNWIAVANPSPTETIWGGVLVGNPDNPIFIDGDWIGPNQTRSFQNPSMGGPVFALGFKSGSQVPNAPIVASQRVLWGPSFGEIAGVSEGDVNYTTSNWTWYDQKETGVTNWVLISNLYNQEIYTELRIAGTPIWGSTIAPYNNKTPNFPGMMGGPVEVEAWLSEVDGSGNQRKQTPIVVFASQRVVWNGYFNEVVGKGM